MYSLALLFLLSLQALTVRSEGNDPQFRQPVNCAKQSDGNYVWGCSRFYSICTNGRELPMQCYAGLKLNPDNNQCDNPANIGVCQDGNNSPTLYRSKDPFNCADHADGTYEANPCSPAYIQCSQGRRFDQTCPNGLLFNTNAGVCDFAAKCKKTKRRLMKKMAHIAYAQAILQDTFSDPSSPTAPQSPYGQQQPYQPYQQPQQQNSPPTQADPPQQAFTCDDKADGVYTEQANTCSSQFWKCANGQAFTYNCTTGLVYNSQNGQCDYRQFVTACGGTPPEPSTTPVPPPPINAPPFDCTGRPEGFYADRNCGSSYFYSCLGGRSTAMQCGAGLVFDAMSNGCDYPDSCGKPTTPLPPQQQDPVQPNLEHGTSGYYFGGKQYSNVAYAMQYAGSPQQFQTPSGGQQQQPGAPQQQGGGQQQPGGVPQQFRAVAQQPSGAQPPQQPSPSGGGQPRFNCAGRQNGYYVQQQCSPHFFSCSNGITTRETCPGELVFDIQNAQCEFRSICGQSPPSSPNQPFSPETSQQQPNPPNSFPIGPVGGQQPPQQQAPPPPTIACAGRQDGYYYKQPCQDSFIICSSGNAIVQSCPAGTLFEPATAQCEHRSQCGQQNSNAGGESPQQPEGGQQIPPEQSQQPGSGIIPAPSPPQQQAVQMPGTETSGFSCLGRPNGYYFQRPCQSSWTICSNGLRMRQSCPQGLVFDPANAQCEFASVCGKSSTTEGGADSPSPSPSGGQQFPPPPPAQSKCGQCPSQPPVNQPQQSFQVAQPNQPAQPNQQAQPFQQAQTAVQPPAQPQSPPPSRPPPSFNCRGRQDGNYLSSQCQPNYVVCSGGNAMAQSCPQGLVFDADTAQCEFPSQCGRNSQQQEQPGTGQVNSPQSPNGAVQPPPQQPPQPNQQSPSQVAPVQPPANRPAFRPSSTGFTCAGRVDGYYYRKACTPHFFTCVGGHATQLTCPGNLVFDPSRALCQYTEVCGQPSQPEQNGIAEPTVPQPPPPQTNFNCEGRLNGYYVRRGCTPYFYTCLGGMATKLTCPGSLVFDIQSHSCQYPDICASQQQPEQSPGTAPSSPSNSANFPPAPQQVRPVQPPQSQPMPPPPQPFSSQPQASIRPRVNAAPPPSSFKCSGRPNGAYATGVCTNDYVTCSNGFAHPQRCPGQLVFSPAANNTCDFQSICQSASEAPAPPPPPSNAFPGQQQPTIVGTVPNNPLIPAPPNPNAPSSQQPLVPMPNAPPVPANRPAATVPVPANQQPPPPPSGNQQPPAQAQQGRGNQPAGQAAPPTGGGVQGRQLPPRQPNQPSPVVQPTSSVCSSTSEGMQGQGCNNQFYACSNGITTQMNCPVGLFFDDDTQQCDMQESIVACGGEKKNQTLAQQQGSSSTPAPVSIPSSEFDCGNRAIGYYSKGCSGRYYSCTGMTTYAHNCPSELKYDQEAVQCEYQENVPECGGSRPTTPAPVGPPPAQQQAVNGNTPQESQPPSPVGGNQGTGGPQPQPMPSSGQHPQRPVSNPCVQLPNGSYGPPSSACSRYYFNCYNGQTHDYLCDEGYIYSSPSCVPAQQVPSCPRQ